MNTKSMKKTELHLHLDGSLSHSFYKTMTQEIGLAMTDAEIRSAVTVPEDCTSLVEYLRRFELPTKILQTERALTLAVLDLIHQLEAQHVFYAEIRFAPQLHTNNGLSQQQAVEAVLKGVQMAKQEQLQVQIGILLCMMVTGAEAANRETAELAAAYKNKGIAGLDLAGAEGAVPMLQFKPLFQIAYQAALPFTIHAGECGDYENINQAVSFGARRIGHGCAARFSEDCMRLLEREKIALEMCPTSNLQTRAVPSLEEHPVKEFLKRGLLVTVNTDNMTASNTTLDKEYAALKKYLQFTDADLQLVNENARKAAFSAELLSCSR